MYFYISDRTSSTSQHFHFDKMSEPADQSAVGIPQKTKEDDEYVELIAEKDDYRYLHTQESIAFIQHYFPFIYIQPTQIERHPVDGFVLIEYSLLCISDERFSVRSLRKQVKLLKGPWTIFRSQLSQFRM